MTALLEFSPTMPPEIPFRKGEVARGGANGHMTVKKRPPAA